MAQRLCFEERARIKAACAAGFNASEIAVSLGRHPTTVQRELARGGGACGYEARAAQRACEAAARRPRTPKLAADAELTAEVAERLDQRWSPHAISADVKTFGYSVSVETIYRACYANTPCSGLKAGSFKKLPTQRRRRRRRSRCEQAKRSPLGLWWPLSARPAEASGRSEFGHWEGDLIIGARNATAAVTLVERLSRYTLIAALDDGYDAAATAAAVTAALSRQPEKLVKTLTSDQGTETAHWTDVETELGI